MSFLRRIRNPTFVCYASAIVGTIAIMAPSFKWREELDEDDDRYLFCYAISSALTACAFAILEYYFSYYLGNQIPEPYQSEDTTKDRPNSVEKRGDNKESIEFDDYNTCDQTFMHENTFESSLSRPWSTWNCWRLMCSSEQQKRIMEDKAWVDYKTHMFQLMWTPFFVLLVPSSLIAALQEQLADVTIRGLIATQWLWLWNLVFIFLTHHNFGVFTKSIINGSAIFFTICYTIIQLYIVWADSAINDFEIMTYSVLTVISYVMIIILGILLIRLTQTWISRISSTLRSLKLGSSRSADTSLDVDVDHEEDVPGFFSCFKMVHRLVRRIPRRTGQCPVQNEKIFIENYLLGTVLFIFLFTTFESVRLCTNLFFRYQSFNYELSLHVWIVTGACVSLSLCVKYLYHATLAAAIFSHLKVTQNSFNSSLSNGPKGDQTSLSQLETTEAISSENFHSSSHLHPLDHGDMSYEDDQLRDIVIQGPDNCSSDQQQRQLPSNLHTTVDFDSSTPQISISKQRDAILRVKYATYIRNDWNSETKGKSSDYLDQPQSFRSSKDSGFASCNVSSHSSPNISKNCDRKNIAVSADIVVEKYVVAKRTSKTYYSSPNDFSLCIQGDRNSNDKKSRDKDSVVVTNGPTSSGTDDFDIADSSSKNTISISSNKTTNQQFSIEAVHRTKTRVTQRRGSNGSTSTFSQQSSLDSKRSTSINSRRKKFSLHDVIQSGCTCHIADAICKMHGAIQTNAPSMPISSSAFTSCGSLQNNGNRNNRFRGSNRELQHEIISQPPQQTVTHIPFEHYNITQSILDENSLCEDKYVAFQTVERGSYNSDFYPKERDIVPDSSTPAVRAISRDTTVNRMRDIVIPGLRLFEHDSNLEGMDIHFEDNGTISDLTESYVDCEKQSIGSYKYDDDVH